jgi:hypothetical protein
MDYGLRYSCVDFGSPDSTIVFTSRLYHLKIPGIMLAGRVPFMDWLQFVDGMVGHLAWPVVAAVLIIVLRKHIGALAERLTKLSFGGVEFALGGML